MPRRPAARAAGLAALGLLAAGPLAAQTRNIGPGVPDRPDTAWPRSTGETWVAGADLQSKQQADLVGPRDGRARYGLASTEVLLATWLLMPHGFALHVNGRVEPAPRFFPDPPVQDHAAFTDELYLSWSRGAVDLYGGKIHPRFGFSWDRGPGLYGTDYGRDYELREKVGAGGRLWLAESEALGRHNLQAEMFRADRSDLSGGLFARRQIPEEESAERLLGDTPNDRRPRWKNRLALGTPDNVAGLRNAAVSLGGFRVPVPFGRIGYLVSATWREPGTDAAPTDRAAVERGVSLGAFGTIPLPWTGVEIAPLAEWVRRDSAGGFRGRSGEWGTVGASLRMPAVTLAYAWMGNRQGARPGEVPERRAQHSASATWHLNAITDQPLLRGVSLTLGWRDVRETAETTNRTSDWGLAATWGYRF